MDRAPVKPITLIADVEGNRLYRIEDGGQWEGDFWYVLSNGESGYIVDYSRDDEDQLIVDFTEDYKNGL